jgi:hypothetical protein
VRETTELNRFSPFQSSATFCSPFCYFVFSIVIERKLSHWRFLLMGSVIKFYSFVIRLGLLLALSGQLKSCTLVMMGKAAQKTQQGIMSYSKLNCELWR